MTQRKSLMTQEGEKKTIDDDKEDGKLQWRLSMFIE